MIIKKFYRTNQIIFKKFCKIKKINFKNGKLKINFYNNKKIKKIKWNLNTKIKYFILIKEFS